MSETNVLTFSNSFSDKSACILSVPQCITTGDISGDGNYRILIATVDQKLLCFDGSRRTHEVTIPEIPSSVCVHYSTGSIASLPLVAVGAGNSILFYLNLRQYSKFVLPPPYKCDEEMRVYETFKVDNDILKAKNDLRELNSSGKPLTSHSLSFISADLSYKNVMNRYIKILSDICATDCVTCITTIKANVLAENKATRLLVGTESRYLFLLDSKDTYVEKRWEFTAAPSTIKASGFMSGTSLIVVLCRDRIVRVITNLSERYLSLRCDSLPVDVAICGELIYVALMSQCVKMYDSAGKELNTVFIENNIVSLDSLDVEEQQLSLCVVACNNGDIIFIDKGSIFSTSHFEEGITALFFGRVGRQPNNILSISKNNGLYLRNLSRVAPVVKTKKESVQLDPIPIPKKNQLFLQDCENERQNDVKMFDEWNNSVRYLQMLTANNYAQILESSVLSPIDDINFTSKLLGMGPAFILHCTALNTGKRPVNLINIALKHDTGMYRVFPNCVQLPTLVSGYKYMAKFRIEALNPEGKTDTIQIIATSPYHNVPLCLINVQMPVPQFPVNSVN